MDDKLISPGVAFELDALIVGAGFSGLYTLYRLRELGFTVRAFERGSDVGGTWYWNRYPGLKCDTETISYSFTFDRHLYREWTWSRRFAPQTEIEAYARFVSDRLDLAKDIEFDTSVTAAVWDEGIRRWRVTLDSGAQVICRYFITGVGPLSTANVPDVEGFDDFTGAIYHTGRWPHGEKVDFTGKRVAVIGTGSSGAQIITAIAGEVAHLGVYQRTPQYITPAQDRALTPEYVRQVKDNLDTMIEEMRTSSFGAPGTKTDRSAFDHTPQQRQEVFQAAWDHGAQAFALATYKDLATDVEANTMAADFVRGKIAEIVDDPAIAAKLMPDYLFGTKRPIKVDGYYEVFNRANVALHDLREAPIEQITASGIRTAHGEEQYDIIVFATGFDSFTGTFFGIDIRGRDGRSLREKWDDGAAIETYLGVGVHGFPNMFMVVGPQSPSVQANFLFGIQQSVGFIAPLLDWARAHGVESVEATERAEQEWVAHVQELAEQTLIPRTKSWWTKGNIEGRPSAGNFPMYVGGVKNYGEVLDRVVANGYEGFATDSQFETDADGNPPATAVAHV